MGNRTFAISAVFVAFTAATASGVWAQDSTSTPLVVAHPVLAASVERLAAKSPSWRDAMKAVASSGRRAVLITPDQFDGKFDPETLAQAEPIGEEPSRVDYVLVIVNLDLLQKLSRLPVAAEDFEDDVDRILAHEVYGHAVPFLLAGSFSAKCADPVIGQSAIASCVIQRENVIRREMRLGQRVEYGRESLAVARRYWQ